MAAEKEQAGDTNTVSDADLVASFGGAAYHSNRFFTVNMPAGLRIAFMEQLGETVPSQFRTAVVLAYPDAIQLRNLLTRQLKGMEEQIAEAEAKAKSAQRASGGANTK